MGLALAGGTDTIVTIHAGLAGYRIMIKQGNLPVTGVVAHITSFIGGHMIRSLSVSNDTIVTTGTGTEHLRVIHQGIHWTPDRTVMA